MFTEDIVTGHPRIIAPARSRRLGPRPEGCPFCPGNEEVTPPEICRVGGGGGDWHARVVPNLFPLGPEHEVIVMSDRHLISSRYLTPAEWSQGLEAWQLRSSHYQLERGDSAYVHLFLNDGRTAGASLEHCHAQLLVIPHTAASRELSTHVRADDCALCAWRPAGGPLLIWESTEFLVCASPSPRTSEGLLLFPRRHVGTLRDCDVDQLSYAMQAAANAVPEGDFNCWLVQDPFVDAHWYIEYAPRTAVQAGVELALGIGVSTVDPEVAADNSRKRLAAAGLEPAARKDTEYSR